VITGVGVNFSTLYIVGTNDADGDHVSVNKVGKDEIRVHADFIPQPFRTFDLGVVDQIIAYLCDGDDHLTIAKSVLTPAIIHSGAGNDHVVAGGGPTVLLGDAGNDMLVGGKGRTILVGGTGLDRLVGGSADDILIGGSTDADDVALATLLGAWNNNDSYANRVLAVDALLTVMDDLEEDKLTGSAGTDLFYDGLGDVLTDLKPGETVL
jgi:Ca2+-binding RTX toxin-like protein